LVVGSTPTVGAIYPSSFFFPRALPIALLLFCLFFSRTSLLAAGFFPDRRELAPDTRPYLSIARLHANGGIGCGTLVGPDLVLTCAHVVSDPAGLMHNDIRVELGVGSALGIREAKVRYAFFAPKGGEDPASGLDWALVRIDRPLGLLYGWVEVLELGRAQWLRTPLELAGYGDCPDDLRPELSGMSAVYRCACKVSDVGPSIVFHDGSMWGGTSGAPIFARVGAKDYVVAVNSAGVDVEGEQLIHGFRSTYMKELANIAVPAAKWIHGFKEFPPGESSNLILRKLWVRNTSRRLQRVSVNYTDVLSSFEAVNRIKPWIEVAPGARVAILEFSDGCGKPDYEMAVTDSTGKSTVKGSTRSQEVDGEIRYYARRSFGATIEATISIP